ncbi:hypothetical protein BZG35_16820 [Brevundimonas sp. LM2]|uniref:cyclic pyranopterin monophosphate synthase MoaC n=1 Tax=Brevundimonas sp. LM2 TaxID=1938605 RepID=UPI000983C23B|nr:cyclic pyranopterin monophosphate synthase MoaC [Brevundimonas sp. LM2]AQR63126.1 hypothetical protein BZG35_16820 [Brevundimonas sp. LM2]
MATVLMFDTLAESAAPERTSDLIPTRHPLMLSSVEVSVGQPPDGSGLGMTIDTARLVAKTGGASGDWMRP